MGCEPLFHLACVVNLGIVGDDGEMEEEWRGVGPSERVEQVEEEAGLLALPHTMRDGPGGQFQRSC